MNLVLDIGNSFAKVGCFDQQNLVQKYSFQAGDELRNFLQQTSVEHVLISSVSSDAKEVSSWCKALHTFIFDATLKLPVKNNYSTPTTLGMDRLASACGGWSLFPNQPILVIDVGTCINYEFVTDEGSYQGGAISPGIRMRFEAMNKLTARLPLAYPVEQAPLTGPSTLTSLQSGVMNGTLEEIRGFIHRYQSDNPGLRVILCGGDRHFFENHLKPSIFVAPDLVLTGLNSILLHNVNT